MVGELVRFERQESFQAGREALWALISDTERLNREVGLPPVRFSFTPLEIGGSLLRGEARIAGMHLRYREEPYHWIRPESFSVRRLFENGPLREMVLGLRLEALEDSRNTRAHAFADVLPRHPLITPAGRAVATATVNGLLGACRTFETFLQGQFATPYPRHSAQPPADKARLARVLARLRQEEGDGLLADRLAEHITRAPIEDVITIRPFALADRWGVDRLRLLQTCLRAVRAELLELRWRVLCPTCRGASDAWGHLGEMTSSEAHCPSCNIRFGPEFDSSVEVCFSVATAIRNTRHGDATYCIGGPATAPHVVAQWPLEEGREWAGALHLPPGRYALVSPQAERVMVEVTENDVAEEVSVTLCPQGRRGQITLPDSRRLPASGRWRVASGLKTPAVLRLESPQGRGDIVTAALVTSLQAFRDMFSSEVLSPGVDLAVRQIVVLFSDLKGSTTLYRERGDAPSYAAVRDHFGFLRDIVRERGGGIVKTIGDAIMAVFPDPADALSAALQVQRLAPLRPDPLVIKLGLHAGPALAVNANGLLDYFGQTVNIAARVQGQSVGGDVIITESLAEDERVAALLTDVRVEHFRITPRGTSEPLPLIRLWPAGS